MQVMQSITAREMNQEKRQELMINAGRTQEDRLIKNGCDKRKWRDKEGIRSKGIQSS
jgi:hypothetical protein